MPSLVTVALLASLTSPPPDAVVVTHSLLRRGVWSQTWSYTHETYDNVDSITISTLLKNSDLTLNRAGTVCIAGGDEPSNALLVTLARDGWLPFRSDKDTLCWFRGPYVPNTAME